MSIMGVGAGGGIVWLCSEGERIKRAGISGRNKAGMQDWTWNEDLQKALAERLHSNVG